MGLTLDPALAREDIDIERGGATGDGEPPGEFGWRKARGARGFELKEREEGTSGKVKIGEGVDGGPVERAGGSHQLAKRRKAGGVIRTAVRDDGRWFGEEPAGMHRAGRCCVAR
jgi:hypothetical protein